MDCQKSLIDLQDNFGNVTIHNLITIGAVNMIESDGLTIKASDNQAVDFHPRWSQISVFDPRQYINPCTQEPANTNPDLPAGADAAVRTENDEQLAYLTIVNGCPYAFEFLSQHNHQMKDWDSEWVTIPAGMLPSTIFFPKTRVISLKYAQGSQCNSSSNLNRVLA